MTKYIFFVLFSFVSTLINAQNVNNHKPLVAEGKIPKVFTTPSSEKYKADISKISTQTRSKEKKTRKRFALETNFLLDDMLQSGRVVFNDKISNYLNDVVSRLFKSDESRLSKVKVYTLRSASVNAFATSRGEILVTLGLLAKLENEAQLAFVLCHELTHVQEQHALELYLDANGVGKDSKNQDVLKNGRFSEKVLAKHNYKKELETEADQKGLERFKQTKYSTATLLNTFDILKGANLPFGNDVFDLKVFESEFYVLPPRCREDSIPPITFDTKEKDDSASTHPNINKRKIYVFNALENADNKDKSDYLVSKEQFREVQEMARYELPMLHLKNEEYAQAIYVAHLLLLKNPENLYAKKCIAKALYFHNKYQNEPNVSRYSDRLSSLQGESERVHYLLYKLPSEDLTIMTMRYAWLLLQSAPKDTELKRITEDLAIVLAHHAVKLDTFKSLEEILLLKNTLTLKSEKAEGEGFSTINLGKAKWIEGEIEKDPNSYWKYGFAEFKNDSAFIRVFKRGEEKEKEIAELDKFFDSKAGKKFYKKEEERHKKKGYKLGIDKIVVIAPHYVCVDERKSESEQLDFIETEKKENDLKQVVKDLIPKIKLKVSLLDPLSLQENQVNEFNDIRYFNEWFSEQIGKYNQSLTMGSEQAAIDSLVKKYGTQYFLWTGVVSVREKRGYAGKAFQAFMSLFFPIILPSSVYNYVKPEYDMLYYAILYDVKTSRRQILSFDFYDCKDSTPMLKAHCYDTFQQIYLRGK